MKLADTILRVVEVCQLWGIVCECVRDVENGYYDFRFYKGDLVLVRKYKVNDLFCARIEAVAFFVTGIIGEFNIKFAQQIDTKK